MFIYNEAIVNNQHGETLNIPELPDTLTDPRRELSVSHREPILVSLNSNTGKQLLTEVALNPSLFLIALSLLLGSLGLGLTLVGAVGSVLSVLAVRTILAVGWRLRRGFVGA